MGLAERALRATGRAIIAGAKVDPIGKQAGGRGGARNPRTFGQQIAREKRNGGASKDDILTCARGARGVVGKNRRKPCRVLNGYLRHADGCPVGALSGDALRVADEFVLAAVQHPELEG